MKDKIVIAKKLNVSGFNGTLYLTAIRYNTPNWSTSKVTAKEFTTTAEADKFISKNNLMEAESTTIQIRQWGS